MKELTASALQGLVIEMIGGATSDDGVFLSDRKVWVSNLNFLRATCPTCGQEFAGPDYNVYHMLATHDYGHRKMEEIAQAAHDMENFDDEEKGGATA